MSLYCRVTNEGEVLPPTNLPQQYSPDGGNVQIINFHLIDDPAEFEWYPFTATTPPDYDPQTQKLVRNFVVENNQATDQYEVVPLDDTEASAVLTELKNTRINQVRAKYEELLDAGFPHNFGTEEEPVWETLQCRHELDRTNWLALKDACLDAVMAGMGDQVAALPIRCTSNNMYYKTYNEIIQILAALRGWAAMLQGIEWAKKDAIRSAATIAEVEAIDPFDFSPL